MAQYFGIDIGGSGIKGALVDADNGELIGERVRVDAPQPSTPDAVADAVKTLVFRHGKVQRSGGLHVSRHRQERRHVFCGQCRQSINSY